MGTWHRAAPPKKWSGQGRPPKLLRRDDKHKPASVKELALALPTRAWRRITWPGATGEKLSSRFSRVRVRVAHRDYWLADSRPEEWLVGHLEKFLSPSRCESDSLTARGNGRMEEASHGAEGLFRCRAQAGGDQRQGRSAGDDQEDRAMGGFPR